MFNLLKLLVANKFLASTPLIFGERIHGNSPVAASIIRVYGVCCLGTI